MRGKNMKIFFKTFGCRVNQIESQSILEQAVAGGFKRTSDFKTADACLLNTCTVTENADRDVERTLRQIVHHNPNCKLVVAGCYGTMHPEKVFKIAPKAKVINNEEKTNISKILSIPKIHRDFTITQNYQRTRAFVKIQDGCDRNCTYCIVKQARGVLWSKPLPRTMHEIENLVSNGYKEIVLSGINIGNYQCHETKADLADLTDRIFKIKGDFRIRFSSIEVNSITDKLIKAAKQSKGKFCSYFHIPLQSGSDKVLKEMNREYDSAFYKNKTDKLKKTFSGIGIFADVIAGYPTETKADFEKTVNFINEIGFEGLHVFSYSMRPFTGAAKLKNLPKEIIAQRAKVLRELDKTLRRNFAESLVGTIQKVLVEQMAPPLTPSSPSLIKRGWGDLYSKKGGGGIYKSQAVGLAGNFQKVVILSSGCEVNKFYLVKITKAENGICYGKTVL
jgi:threonylcarbamoyladenosine tRNA methylthiotransferase MtaB